VLVALPTVARALIERQARPMRAVLVDAPSSVSLLAQPGASGLFAATTARARYPDLRPLPGAHQHGNLCVALALLEVAAEAGLPWDADALARGLATTHWPGRLQRVAGRPELLLDGAHNPAAARALAAHLADQPPHVLLFAVMRDKDVAGLAHALFPLARAVVLTRAPSAGPRGADASEVAARLGHLAPACHVDERLPHALATAEALAGPAGLLIVAGSLALVGDVLGLLETRARSGA
jgi:dihydrofolate synthase/folylpolyglutamate synthase